MTCKVILLPTRSAIDPDDYEPRKLARDLSRAHVPDAVQATAIRMAGCGMRPVLVDASYLTNLGRFDFLLRWP